MPINFSPSQQRAADSLRDFLVNDDKEIICTGAPGSGKTYLMSWFKNQALKSYETSCAVLGIPIKYTECYLTATTHKAAEVLSSFTGSEVSTIHSLLGIIVKEDYKTGITLLQKSKDTIIKNAIIIIDEASMIGKDLYNLIHESIYNCKIIYVGDKNQLLPVKSTFNLFNQKDIKQLELTENMRFKNSPALITLAEQLKKTVEINEFNPIIVNNKEIIKLSGEALKKEIDSIFSDPENKCRICTYTNARSIEYNNYIRKELRHYTEPYIKGEHLISAGTLINNNKTLLNVEDEVVVNKVLSTKNSTELGLDLVTNFDYTTLIVTKLYDGNIYTFNVPLNQSKFREVLKQEARRKNFRVYYYLKNTFGDLRPRDACTIHKVQGSTFDTIFIDMGDISTCKNPSTVTRLLYVACTRARNKVILMGNLSKRYGGIAYV